MRHDNGRPDKLKGVLSMIPGPAPTSSQIALAVLKGDPDSVKKAESPYGKPTNFEDSDMTAEEKWQAAKQLDDIKKEADARGVDTSDPAAKQVLTNYDNLQAFTKLSAEDQKELQRAGVSLDKLVLAFKGSLKNYVKSREREEGDSFQLDRDPLVRMMKEEIRGLRLAEEEKNREGLAEAIKEAGGDTEKAKALFEPVDVAKTIEEAFQKTLEEVRRDKREGEPRDRLDLSPQARTLLGLDREDAGAPVKAG